MPARSSVTIMIFSGDYTLGLNPTKFQTNLLQFSSYYQLMLRGPSRPYPSPQKSKKSSLGRVKDTLTAFSDFKSKPQKCVE